MSGPVKPKDHGELSNIFSIDLENEFTGVPGITALTQMVKEKKALPATGLAPGKTSIPVAPTLPKSEASVKPKADGPDKTSTPPKKPGTLPSISSIAVKSDASRIMEVQRAKTLAELGVQFELIFEPERGSYRYVKMKPHAQENLALWQQKFYFQMKLDLKTLEVFGTFQEFNKDKHSFQAEAFALTDSDFVQVIRIASAPQKIYVLVSKSSLLAHEEAVKRLLEEAATPAGDDFKIEMAS